MLPFYPDKPVLSSPTVFEHLKPGEWLCQYKMDGFRCLIEIGHDFSTFTTRHNKPCPVSPDVAKETHRRLAHLPVGTILDAEWMGRRAGLEERFWVFDVLRVGTVVGTRGVPAIERFSRLSVDTRDGAMVPANLIVPHTLADYAAFYEKAKLDPTTEGVVLKRCDSKLILSVRGCVDNPAWLKVKYRAGSSGQVET